MRNPRSSSTGSIGLGPGTHAMTLPLRAARARPATIGAAGSAPGRTSSRSTCRAAESCFARAYPKATGPSSSSIRNASAAGWRAKKSWSDGRAAPVHASSRAASSSGDASPASSRPGVERRQPADGPLDVEAGPQRASSRPGRRAGWRAGRRDAKVARALGALEQRRRGAAGRCPGPSRSGPHEQVARASRRPARRPPSTPNADDRPVVDRRPGHGAVRDEVAQVRPDDVGAAARPRDRRRRGSRGSCAWRRCRAGSSGRIVVPASRTRPGAARFAAWHAPSVAGRAGLAVPGHRPRAVGRAARAWAVIPSRPVIVSRRDERVDDRLLGRLDRRRRTGRDDRRRPRRPDVATATRGSRSVAEPRRAAGCRSRTR